MHISLQQLLFNFPLYKLAFLTEIPQKLLYYTKIHQKIPEMWLIHPTLCILQEEAQQLNDLTVSSRMIQDPNLVAVIICSEHLVSIQAEVLALFQECGIPILQIYDAEGEQWFERQEDEFLPFSQLTQELSGFGARGFTEVAENVAQALNTPLLYLNDQFQVLWETGQPILIKEARRWINIHQRELAMSTAAANSFKAYALHIPGLAPQWLVVSSTLNSWQKQFIDKLAGLTSLFLQTESKTQEFFDEVKNHFVYDLLYHKFESQKVMIEQGKIWGWNLEKPHHLLLVDIDFSAEWSGDGDGPTVNDLIGELEIETESYDEVFHPIPFDDQIVVLLEAEENRSNKNLLVFAQKLKAKLASRWGGNHFWMGIGKWYQESTHLNKSYQEAKLALQFGRGWYPDQNIFHYNNLGVIRLLMHVHQGVLADFSNDYLSVLKESDAENSTEYLQTLQILIQYRWKLEEVANVLFVHPNTLRNRVKKIEKILGIDFQDSEEFSNIMIAVKIQTFFDS